jgi:hypothetical protein
MNRLPKKSSLYPGCVALGIIDGLVTIAAQLQSWAGTASTVSKTSLAPLHWKTSKGSRS